MARHLISLRLALLRGNVRASGPWTGIGLLASLLIGAMIGGVGGYGLSLARTAPDSVAAEAVYGSTAFVFVIWLLGPLLTPGGGAGLDPGRLALFPIRTSQLLPGLTGAACIGAGGVATVLVLAGAATATAVNSFSRLIALPAMALALATCVVASQLAATALSSLSSSRRYRDVALFVAPALGIGFQLLGRMAGTAANDDGRGLAAARGLRLVGRLLPTGWAARAMVDARLGRPASALIGLAGGVVVLAVLYGLWGVVLERALVSSGPTTGSVTKGRAASRGLYPALVDWFPRRRWSVVAAKELRLLWRDPRQRVYLMSSVFYGTFPVVSSVLSSGGADGGGVVLLAAVPAFTLGAGSTNLYGFDGAAHWTNVAAGDDARSDLLGKQVARLVVAVGATAVLSVGLALRTGAWSAVPVVMAIGVGAFGLAIGLSTLVSVRVPFAMPDSRTNVFASGDGGRGFAAFGPSVGVFLGTSATFAPLVLMFLASFDTGGVAHVARLTGVGLCAMVVGAVGWRTATDRAVKISGSRQPELLESLTRC